MKAIYPEFPWQMSKFLEGKTYGAHKDKEQLLELLTEAEQKLGIQKVWRSIYNDRNPSKWSRTR